MKYAIIGLGAVGSIIAGVISNSSQELILIGKKYQLKPLRKKGIRIHGFKNIDRVKNLKVTDNISSIKNVDVIFICVKSQDTEELAHKLKKYVKKSTLIVSLQNGIRNASKIRKITKNKVISGVILFNAVYAKVGHVHLTMKGNIILENEYNYGDKLKNILSSDEINAKLVSDIEGFLWSKLLVNLQIAVTALTGQTINESIYNKDSRKIIIETMKEGLSILEKSNKKIDVLHGLDPKKMIKNLSRYNTLLLKIGSKLMGLKNNARNSMWQSLSRSRSTEIDFINGEIIRLAEKNNLSSPINSKLVELIKKQELKDKISYYEPSELRNILKI